MPALQHSLSQYLTKSRHRGSWRILWDTGETRGPLRVRGLGSWLPIRVAEVNYGDFRVWGELLR